MNLNLTRVKATPKGIFGRLTSDVGQFVCFTLEHSYECIPKLPAGDYVCKRGNHRLEGRPQFETFEVMDVPGHTGILFHIGNYNDDSNGCILLGMQYNSDMISNSSVAFDDFLRAQEGCDVFSLHVDGCPQASV